MAQNLANPKITHVFVLMLENRSFDHMLGFSGLTGVDASTGQATSINGASADNSNSFNDTVYPAGTPADDIMPFDPGHEFTDVLEQLCGAGTRYDGVTYPPINNSGFVSNYATSKSAKVGGPNPNFGEVMKCYNAPAQLPVLYALVKAFAVCDNWHASMPGPTWPNRFFVHAASSGGLDHSPRLIESTEWETIRGFRFPNGTIFDQFRQHPGGNKGYRLYRGEKKPLIGSIPIVAALKGIEIWDTHPYESFQSDINGNYPYSYTFIEPNYGDIVNNSYAGGQSQHPMDDIRNGEALIKSTYEAIRNSPLWENSLLIITYDEHGGFYDHAAPPAAIAPGDTVPQSKYNQYGFDFKRYGVRVPAIVVSAYTTENSISHLLYDHASVPATLESVFGLPALTNRDAAANNVTSLASLPTARTNTPQHLPEPAVVAPERVAAMRSNQVSAKQDNDPIDGGNLPGFLQVVMKSQINKAPQDAAKSFLMDRVSGSTLRTRLEARQYLEKTVAEIMKPG